MQKLFFSLLFLFATPQAFGNRSEWLRTTYGIWPGQKLSIRLAKTIQAAACGAYEFNGGLRSIESLPAEDGNPPEIFMKMADFSFVDDESQCDEDAEIPRTEMTFMTPWMEVKEPGTIYFFFPADMLPEVVWTKN